MNRHGETYSDQPPAGEYWLCPLYECKFKLLYALPIDVTKGLKGMNPFWTIGSSASWFGAEHVTDAQANGLLVDYVQAGLEAHMHDRENRMRLHLSGHSLMDFYLTRAEVMDQAHKKVAAVMSLVEMVHPGTETGGW